MNPEATPFVPKSITKEDAPINTVEQAQKQLQAIEQNQNKLMMAATPATKHTMNDAVRKQILEQARALSKNYEFDHDQLILIIKYTCTILKKESLLDKFLTKEDSVIKSYLFHLIIKYDV